MDFAILVAVVAFDSLSSQDAKLSSLLDVGVRQNASLLVFPLPIVGYFFGAFDRRLFHHNLNTGFLGF